ncbi:MAG: hypothetical protein IPK06_17090 [Ignavibacteriae bacterium]|nr:hypothetical protein [Ignavibacteriota bacterium]
MNPTTNFGPFDQSFVQETIDEGAVFISYIGHSGTRTWDNSITEPEQLNNNRNRSPLVTDYGCSTGKFAESDINSYSELFVLSEKSQGIAYIGNSSLGFTSTAVTFPRIFYKKILSENILIISEALNQGKVELIQNNGSTLVNQLFSLTNTLIGDPVISLPIPQKSNLAVTSKDLFIKNSVINDALDSIKCLVDYYNFGRVEPDTVKIIVTDTYEDRIIFQKEELRKIPNYKDSLFFSIPVKNKPGKHQLTINIDNENKIDEIYENDNEVIYDMYVASSSTRTLLNFAYENSVDSNLIVLNPSTRPQIEKLQYDISNDENFTKFKSNSVLLDTFYTKIKLNSLITNKRYFIRTKLENETDFGIIKTFFINSKFNYLLADSLSYLNSKKVNVEWKTNIKLDSTTTKISVSSAGFYDGRSALIFKDDTNYVPENFKTGHHIALFDRSSLKFIQYKYFNTYSGGSAVLSEYKTFLDTLSQNYFILIGVSDDGRISDAELRTKLYGIGSKFIDSLQFRSSWVILGIKGAAPGTVPEAFSNPTEGPVKVDTSFIKIYSKGNLITSVIGPSSNWKKLVVDESHANNSKITFKPILISANDNTEDTLNTLNFTNNEASLNFIDAKKYPNIKILTEFTAGDNNTSPILNSFGVDYTGIPELAINYQVVSVEKDSVDQGENANLRFYVYNVGESKADSVKVIVEVINSDNSREKIFEQTIKSLDSEKE